MILISYATRETPNWTNFFVSVNVNSEAKSKAHDSIFLSDRHVFRQSRSSQHFLICD
jgi:hypothetical protein